MIGRFVRNVLICVCIGMEVFCLLFGWKQQAENACCEGPGQEWIALDEILSGTPLNEANYRTLFYQTGVGRRTIEAMPEEERKAVLFRAQQLFFTRPVISCSKSSLICWQEENENTSLPEFIGLQEGDILISFCSHTFGWRNGHAAIVVEEKKGQTLEAIVLGEESCLQSVQKWRYYPSFLVLRLTKASREERKEIARYARESMEGIPYGFKTDVLEHLGERWKNTPIDTDCSHLIWKSYLKFEYDLDSDGGLIVTPRDLAESPLLEVIQVYGIDPKTVREK